MIWLYLRFTLSYRDVEELLAERGLDISYETVRRWVLKFGPAIARRLRQRRPRPSNRWHLERVCKLLRVMQDWLGHANAQNTVRCTALAPGRLDKEGAGGGSGSARISIATQVATAPSAKISLPSAIPQHEQIAEEIERATEVRPNEEPTEDETSVV